MKLRLQRPIAFETHAQREAKKLTHLKENVKTVVREMKAGELDSPPRRYIEAREMLERAAQ